MENTATAKKTKVNTSFMLNYKSFAVAVLSVIMILMEWWKPVSSLDEAVGVMCYVLLLFFIITRKVNRFDTITLALVGVVIILGLLANMVFSINTRVFSVAVDVLTQTKVIVAFFAVRYFLNAKEKQLTINYLAPLSQVFIAVSSVFAFINLFADVGMSSSKRYGIKVFNFIYQFNHQYIVCAIFCFCMIVLAENIPARRKRALMFMGIIAIVAALKSIALVFTIVFLFLSVYFRRYHQLSLKVLIPLAVALIFASQFQVESYLLNENAPRRTFLHYAIVDANSHFPLGSGFATFGSAEAAKNYSPLYYQYGFDHMWGMSPQYQMFLHDNYWQTIIGQFGWFGFAVYLVIYVRWFKTSVNENVTSSSYKALPYAIFIAMIISGLGSAALTSSTGIVAFWALGLITSPEDKKNRKKKIKITFR